MYMCVCVYTHTYACIWHFEPFQNKYYFSSRGKKMPNSGGVLEHTQNKESGFVYTRGTT